MTQTQTVKEKPRNNVWQIFKIWQRIVRFHATFVRRKEVSEITRRPGTRYYGDKCYEINRQFI